MLGAVLARRELSDGLALFAGLWNPCPAQTLLIREDASTLEGVSLSVRPGNISYLKKAGLAS